MNYRPRFFIKQRGLTAHLLNDTSTRTRALHQQARSWVRMRRSRACCEAALGFHELQTGQGGFKTSYQGEKMFSCGVSRLLCDTAQHADGRRCRRVSTGEVQPHDKWLCRRYRGARGCPPTCCLSLTEQPVSCGIVPGLCPVFREGARTRSTIRLGGHSAQPARWKDRQARLHSDVTHGLHQPPGEVHIRD